MRRAHALLWPLALVARCDQEKRTYSQNSFSPTLWSAMATEGPWVTETPTLAQPRANGTATSSGGSAPAQTTAVPYQLQTPPLDTPWTDKVGLSPWPDHPRPQLKRDAWLNLNGIWTWESVGSGNDLGSGPVYTPGPLGREVLVPSCIESAISGLQDLNTSQMWYETTFQVPSEWGSQSVLLHFEAVDYEHTVWVNGQEAGSFTGGYFRHTRMNDPFITSRSLLAARAPFTALHTNPSP